MNTILIILAAMLSFAAALPGGRTTAGSGSGAIVPVSAVTAAPVASPPTLPGVPISFDQPGGGPSR